MLEKINPSEKKQTKQNTISERFAPKLQKYRKEQTLYFLCFTEAIIREFDNW